MQNVPKRQSVWWVQFLENKIEKCKYLYTLQMQVGLGNLISIVRVKGSDRIRFFSIDHFYLMKLLIRLILYKALKLLWS